MDDLESFKEAFDKIVETAPLTGFSKLTIDEINDEIKQSRREKDTRKLSEKYKGCLTKEEGLALTEHLKEMREGW